MKRTRHKILSVFLSVCMIFSCMVGMSVPAYATAPDPEPDTSTYTITIPSTFNVANPGWNALDGGISAKGSLESSKKLTVTASSANGFKLKSGDNSVGYTLTTAEGGSQTTSWEFTELSNTETTKPLGIIVDDYSSKPAGTYQDTVTFMAKVENNLVSFTIMRDVNSNSSGNYTVAPGTTWQQFIDSGDAPACLSIVEGKVWHDMNASIMDCGGTLIANTADKKRVKPSDVIIDGATYGCSDYLGYQDHD